jgi:hypothetical protein
MAPNEKTPASRIVAKSKLIDTKLKQAPCQNRRPKARRHGKPKSAKVRRSIRPIIQVAISRGRTSKSIEKTASNGVEKSACVRRIRASPPLLTP